MRLPLDLPNDGLIGNHAFPISTFSRHRNHDGESRQVSRYSLRLYKNPQRGFAIAGNSLYGSNIRSIEPVCP
jgi:hypothetical protein